MSVILGELLTITSIIVNFALGNLKISLASLIFLTMGMILKILGIIYLIKSYQLKKARSQNLSIELR